MLKQSRVDSSIPLVRIVQSFDIWMYSTPGHEGKLVRPSHDLLKKHFGTTNDTEIVQQMLKHGAKQGESNEMAVPTHIQESLNPSRGERVNVHQRY